MTANVANSRHVISTILALDLGKYNSAPKAITATAHKLARIVYNLMRFGVASGVIHVVLNECGLGVVCDPGGRGVRKKPRDRE